MLTGSTTHNAAYFIFAVGWIVLGAFEYGLNIAILNSVQDPLSCRAPLPSEAPKGLSLPPCVPMTDALFGLLTSSYTVGGFFGSLSASRLADGLGRRKAVVYAAALVGVGSLSMSLAPFYFSLLLGRLIIGLGCGLSTVLVPMYLHEVAPPALRGSVGVLNQLGIVFGILAGQALALPFSQPSSWRFIFVVGLGVAGLQALTAPAMVESPVWAKEHAGIATHTPNAAAASPDSLASIADAQTSRSMRDPEDPESQGLLGEDMEEEPLTASGANKGHLSLGQVIVEAKRDEAVRRGLIIVVTTQLAQQASGINAVLYYSTSIMKSVMPASAVYISLFITFVNVLMTFPPIFLIDRVGRRSLLIASASFMSISSFLLALSINNHMAALSSLFIVLFVCSFAIGLGPVPFVILSEVVPPHAASAASSLGLGLNWITNLIVGLCFLPLRNTLSGEKGEGEGNVFFIFTAISAIAVVSIAKNYKH